jgi:DNA-binding transcriptional ArsR family regulator
MWVVKKMANLYRALSDPVRRKILGLLADGKQNQSEIVERFNISQPAITKHLRILSDEGLISVRKQGRYRIYELNREVFRSAYRSMLTEMEAAMGRTLTDLKNYAERGEESEDD